MSGWNYADVFEAVAGAGPRMATVTGPSNRLNVSNVCPLSIAKVRSMKSRVSDEPEPATASGRYAAGSPKPTPISAGGRFFDT